MFAADVPTYIIDLGHAEPERWVEVIAHEKSAVRRLIAEADAELARVPEVVRWLFARLYGTFGGLYRAEMAAWADALSVSPGTVTMLNGAYELSHLHWGKLFGCTAGVRWLDGRGMVHLRSLDWPLASMGAATRLFRFRRGTREFVSVGVPGQVGVLSGMLASAYSITINWAPPAAFPSLILDRPSCCGTPWKPATAMMRLSSLSPTRLSQRASSSRFVAPRRTRLA
jgi:hypothetical protein